MHETKDKDFIPLLKEARELLQSKHDIISELSPTKHATYDRYIILTDNLKKYYEGLAQLLQKKKKEMNNFMKLVEKYNYFLFDDFILDAQFTKEKEEGLDALIFSPFSVNYIILAFKDVLKEYFTETPVPKDELSQSKIISSILHNLDVNMASCPLYLQELLQNGFNSKSGIFHKNLDPKTIFHLKIIDTIFKDPTLFNIIEYTEKVKASEEDLDLLKSIIHENLILDGGFFKREEHLEVLPSQFMPEKTDESTLNDVALINFEKLLIHSKEIPDQLPSDFFRFNLADQIKYLLVDEESEDYQKQKEYFKSLRREFERGRKFVKILKESLPLIKIQIKITEIKSSIENVISSMKLYIEALPENKCSSYIKNPHFFIKNLDERINKSLFSSDDTQDLEPALYNSMRADPKEPIAQTTIMLRGCTLKEFISLRPELKMAEKSFEMRMRMYTDNTNEDDLYEPLVEMSKKEAAKFNSLAAELTKAFAVEKDPYDMMREISTAYSCIKINSHSNHISKVDEEKFIITLFNLVQPKNILSTFVYLFDFLLAPDYSDIFVSNKKSKHFDIVRNVLFKYVLSFYPNESDVFYLTELLRIRNYQVDLVLKNDQIVLHKLADVIALDANDKDAYVETFDGFLQNPLLVNNQAQFTFRFYYKDADEMFPKIFVCNVMDLVQDGYDDLPLSNLDSLVQYLMKKYESQSQE